MVKFNDIVNKLAVVLLWVKYLKGKLRNDGQIIIENIGLQDLGIFMILFVVRRGHVSDGVQELDQKLQSRVEFFIVYLLVFVEAHFDFSIHLSIEKIEIYDLKTRCDWSYIDLEWHLLNL